ncbi:uncharacterized protein MCYG_00603 [Microsporum canis CBS 113480]|uniref:Uncharacterized protein n=1 Tax=Arthroderma otae (strain ATCC MYA-4605 / CBS 113480) TaxID=554155 RepID=C5FD31_ARTOC|nr:uncharacterized protein MCYG_00603 [Microsporum canis CBS 113480]EEQ27715.1 predicted protein [Microsporum canis CBS 113480]
MSDPGRFQLYKPPFSQTIPEEIRRFAHLLIQAMQPQLHGAFLELSCTNSLEFSAAGISCGRLAQGIQDGVNGGRVKFLTCTRCCSQLAAGDGVPSKLFLVSALGQPDATLGALNAKHRRVKKA